MLDEYVSARQLAQILGLSKSGFYTLYKQGKIPRGVKIGHSRRWRVKDFQAWLEQQQEKEQCV